MPAAPKTIAKAQKARPPSEVDPADVATENREGKTWEPEENAKLRLFRDPPEGLPQWQYSAIGKMLGRTALSCRLHFHHAEASRRAKEAAAAGAAEAGQEAEAEASDAIQDAAVSSQSSRTAAVSPSPTSTVLKATPRKVTKSSKATPRKSVLTQGAGKAQELLTQMVTRSTVAVAESTQTGPALSSPLEQNVLPPIATITPTRAIQPVGDSPSSFEMLVSVASSRMREAAWVTPSSAAHRAVTHSETPSPTSGMASHAQQYVYTPAPQHPTARLLSYSDVAVDRQTFSAISWRPDITPAPMMPTSPQADPEPRHVPGFDGLGAAIDARNGSVATTTTATSTPPAEAKVRHGSWCLPGYGQ